MAALERWNQRRGGPSAKAPGTRSSDVADLGEQRDELGNLVADRRECDLLAAAGGLVDVVGGLGATVADALAVDAKVDAAGGDAGAPVGDDVEQAWGEGAERWTAGRSTPTAAMAYSAGPVSTVFRSISIASSPSAASGFGSESKRHQASGTTMQSALG
jgi:hypothetical protein